MLYCQKIKYFCLLPKQIQQFPLNFCLTTVVGCLAPVLIPVVHILVVYHFWQNFNRKIDKNLCSCSCWDSIFKGPYESGVASYKHVYFNSTANSLKIWILTVMGVLMLYEAIRRIISLVLENRVRYSMVVLFISSMFSHYYSWWMFFNYWNDEFYSQWYHQLFYSVSELLSTCIVQLLADKRTSFSPLPALAIVAIATVHILASSWDQFVSNVLRGEGYSYQIVRDVGFMVPDLLHVVVPLLQLKSQQYQIRKLTKHDVSVFISIVAVGLIIVSLI